MSDKRVFRLVHAQARQGAIQCIEEAPDGWMVEVKPPTRSRDQNARMWAMLTDISQQVIWHGHRLNQTEWKHVFTAALKRRKTVPAIDGNGFVDVGTSTREMTKAQMSDLMELMTAFAVKHDVVLHDEAEEVGA